MGCVVNGPGEAREADIGIAGGNGVGLIFKKGEILRKVKEEDLVEELLKEIENLQKEEAYMTICLFSINNDSNKLNYVDLHIY